MADLLKLKSNLEILTIDLLDGTYKLRDLSWATSTPALKTEFAAVPFGAHASFQNFETRVTTMDLIAQDTNTATIRAAQREISEALEAARLYNQHPLWSLSGAYTGTNPWWLHWNIDGESEKRSLIYEGMLSIVNENCIDPFIPSGVSLLRMTIAHHPFWEAKYADGLSISTSSISSWGGTYTVTDVAGDVWARMDKVTLYGTAGSGPLYRTWMGIREEMGGTSNFESIWECEDGTNYNGAGDAADATASDGNKVQKASPAASLTKYWSMTAYDACAAAGHSDYRHQIGEYLVLCRCKVNSGTVGLQLRCGYYNSGATMPSEEVFITNTSWRLIELGRITIPPSGGDTQVYGNYAAYTMIEVYAEQVSGTSTLDLDAICLIPTHHLWTTSGSSIGSASDNTSLVVTAPEDKYTCYGMDDNYPVLGLEYSTKDWYLPTDNSIVVVAGERQTQHVLADDMGLQINYYPRWGMYRGVSGT